MGRGFSRQSGSPGQLSGQPAAANVGSRRRLPAVRAVVGALLVTASALLVMVAHRQAVNDPQTQFVAALVPVSAGTHVSSVRHARELFGSVAVALPPTVAERSVAVDELEALVGQIIAAPMEPGDLLQRTAIVERLVGAAHLLTVELSRTDALNGQLQPGQTVDILATVTEAGSAVTVFVAREVTIAAVAAAAQGAFDAESVVLTLSLDSAEAVQAVGHAARSAAMFLSRAAGATSGGMPPPFRLSTADPSTGRAGQGPQVHGGVVSGEQWVDEDSAGMNDPWQGVWGESAEQLPFHGEGSPPSWWPAP